MCDKNACFTITERILARWLVEGYGLWEWLWKPIVVDLLTTEAVNNGFKNMSPENQTMTD